MKKKKLKSLVKSARKTAEKFFLADQQYTEKFDGYQ